MAADEALLSWASRGPTRLVFRTYAWNRPTLSLGRTERYPEGWDEGALEREGIAVARRPTGGGAVLHAEEVTFALAASVPGPWRLTPRGFSNRASEALSAALHACGLAGSRVAEESSRAVLDPAQRPDASSARERTLCFARSDPGEVEAKGYKVAGLASRFGRAGALCHASVPLTRRSRSIAEFRTSSFREREALEGHARSVGELLGAHPAELESLGKAIAAALEAEISRRFHALLLPASLADVGILEHPAAAVDAMAVPVAP